MNCPPQIYASRNPAYKTPFGAVKAGEAVTFRILLHRDALCEEARMFYRPDAAVEYIAQPLTYAGAAEEGGFGWYT